MNGGDQELEDFQKWIVARDIAVGAKVLTQCKFHEDCFFKGKNDIESAYKWGIRQFADGELGGEFESTKEVTKFIKQVVNDNQLDKCPICEKYWNS